MRSKSALAVVCAAAMAMSFSGCRLLDNNQGDYSSNTASSIMSSSGQTTESVPNSSETGEICTVTIHINFIPNLIFSKYDVDLYIDEVKQETLKHGEDADFELKLVSGEHTIMFANHDDSSVSGSTSFNVIDDIETTYKISCHFDGVDVEEENPNTSSESNSSQIEPVSGEVNVNFPIENAKRAAVVALTNGYATDVFTEDGDYYDPAKLHTYADLSGYHMIVVNDGIWTAKSENMWHVDGLILEDSAFRNKVNAALDITFDGTNYIALNLKGTFGNNNDLALLENEPDEFKNNYLVVKPSMIADDREEKTQNEEEEVGIYFYHRAFQEYGKSIYPYGFDCHWIAGKRAEEKLSDGSYFFKVEVTIKTANKAKREAIAEGIIKYENGNFQVDSFYVS